MSTTAPGTPWSAMAWATAASMAVSGKEDRSSGGEEAIATAEAEASEAVGRAGTRAGARSWTTLHVTSARTPSAAARRHASGEPAMGEAYPRSPARETRPAGRGGG